MLILLGNGHLDVAVANFRNNNVTVLRGNDDGTFQPAQRFAVSNGPAALTVGNVNIDAILPGQRRFS